MIRSVKEEMRILGVDDAAFDHRDVGKTVPVVCTVFRGGKFLDGMLRTDVVIDGMDATDKLVERISSSRHTEQVRVIMLDGITLGGFNIVDIRRLSKETGLPVIVVSRKIPDLDGVREALKNFEDYEERWELIEKAGDMKPCRVRPYNIKAEKVLYYQSVGIGDSKAREIVKLSSTRGFIPEPLRAAHIIATAIVKGESSGRA